MPPKSNATRSMAIPSITLLGGHSPLSTQAAQERRLVEQLRLLWFSRFRRVLVDQHKPRLGILAQVLPLVRWVVSMICISTTPTVTSIKRLPQPFGLKRQISWGQQGHLVLQVIQAPQGHKAQ